MTEIFYILRRGNPWSVRNRKNNIFVCDYPAYNYNRKLLDNVCSAQTEKEVIGLLKDVVPTDDYGQPTTYEKIRERNKGGLH